MTGHAFQCVHARLAPIRPVPGLWLVSRTMRSYHKSGVAQIAQVAMEAATGRPELVFRNLAWYYQQCEPRPGVSVIGDHLMEFAFSGPR